MCRHAQMGVRCVDIRYVGVMCVGVMCVYQYQDAAADDSAVFMGVR